MTDSDEQLPSFEAARDELEMIVRKLEDGNVTLQESLDLWERGEKLAARCDELLGLAEQRLEAATAASEESA